MRTILAQDLKCLPIGRQWQDQRTQVVFDLNSIIDQFPNGYATLVHIRPEDELPHPVDITTDVENGVAIWQIDEVQLEQQGYGKCQLTYHFEDGRAKTRIWKTFIQTSIVTQGPAPDPMYSWMQRFEDLTAQTKANAESARIDAIDAKDASTLAFSSMKDAERSKNEAWSYSVHAQTSKDEAKQFSDSAEEYMYAAERYKNEAAGSSDEVKQYRDDAKSYAQHASTSASDAKTYRDQAAQSAQGAQGNKNAVAEMKQSVQQSVSSIDSKVEAAQLASEEANTYKGLAETSAQEAEQYKNEAKAQADKAKQSQNAASISATNAHTSESLASQYSQQAKDVLQDLHHVAIVDETKQEKILVATYAEFSALEERVRRLQQRV